MVSGGMTAVFTGNFRPFDNRLKISILVVLKDFAEVAGRPELIAMFIESFNLFKNGRVRRVPFFFLLLVGE